ncbi:MAG TPA: thioredoxin family protein [Tepidisphaeraceae bacterium]|nr:thioredoxin family protein [Tepidisphaeraceae bacterium]
MITSEIFRQKFEAGMSLAEHVSTAKPAQVDRWRAMIAKACISAPQRALVESFTRKMNLLIVSGNWCGDCIEQLPLIQAIVDANPSRLALRIVDRDAHADFSARFTINGGARGPVVLFLGEDFEWCATAGDRTLSRYRRIAEKQIGASCSLGAIVPPDDELAAATADWLNEIERVQLMLRLSPRLRQKYGD